MVAICTVPLLAAVAGSVDYVNVTNKAAEVQNALDAAALAMVTRKLDGGLSVSELSAFGETFFRSNLNHASGKATTFTYVDTASPEAQQIVGANSSDMVLLKSSLKHDGMVGGKEWRTTRYSAATISPGKPACILALDKAASAAVKLQGTTKVDLNGCVLASNSSAADAVSRGGTAQLTAECVTAVGGTSGIRSNPQVTLDCGTPQENQYPVPDPLANIQPPKPGACTPVPGGKANTLSPGTYCKPFSGDITLNPGTYVLDGAKVNLGGNGGLTGTGVTIFLINGAELTFNANQVINLSAPTTGPYAGITIYQEKNNVSSLKLNGGAGSNITGFIYAPDAVIQFTGNSATSASDCVRIVGKTVEMNGTSDVSTDCTKELAGREMYAGRFIKLVR